MPWRATKLQRLLSNDMRFGNRPFRFEARSGPLYGRFAIVWIGSVGLFFLRQPCRRRLRVRCLGQHAPGLAAAGGDPAAQPRGHCRDRAGDGRGLYPLRHHHRPGISAAKINHFAAHTSLRGCHVQGQRHCWSLIWLVISNLLILIADARIAGARGAGARRPLYGRAAEHRRAPFRSRTSRSGPRTPCTAAKDLRRSSTSMPSEGTPGIVPGSLQRRQDGVRPARRRALDVAGHRDRTEAADSRLSSGRMASSLRHRPSAGTRATCCSACRNAGCHAVRRAIAASSLRSPSRRRT